VNADRHLVRLAVERVFLDPVETAVDEQKLAEVNELELHVKLVAVHLAIQGQLIRCHTLEGEVGLPVLVVVLCERNGLVVEVEGSAAADERIVHALKGIPVGSVKDDAAPAIVVGKERRPELAVNPELLHIPDAVEWRLRASAPKSVPFVPAAISAQCH
jgi:hypothetical protein